MARPDINPGMSPQAVIQALMADNAYRNTPPNKSQVEEARENLLRQHGYNPEEWTFAYNVPAIPSSRRGKDQQFTLEEWISFIREDLPPGIDLLVLPRAYIGGSYSSSENPTFDVAAWTAFGKLRESSSVFARVSPNGESNVEIVTEPTS